mgnify:CR=1 FL=1
MVENKSDIDIDRLSGESIFALNENIKKHLQESEGFQVMDDLSGQLFPSVVGALNNCLCKPLKKHPRYQNIELVWTGSTAEGVNIPNFDRDGSRAPELELEMDLLCVLRDFEVGRTFNSPAILMQQTDTADGYFVVFVQSPDYRQQWGNFCIIPSDPKRKQEMYLNPLLMIEDLFHQIEHIFKQIPLLAGSFHLEFNPPAVTLTLSHSGINQKKVFIRCDIVIALALGASCLPKSYPSWIQVHGRPKLLSGESFLKIQEEELYLVGKCSPGGQAKVEWRLSFSKLELVLFKEIAARFPAAISCYRYFKLVRYWHLRHPNFLHSYHLKMIFLRACHTFPPVAWTEDNFAANLLGLLDILLHCMATKSLPSYFLPTCNLLEQVHQDFIYTLIQKLSQIRREPMKHLIDLQR